MLSASFGNARKRVLRLLGMLACGAALLITGTLVCQNQNLQSKTSVIRIATSKNLWCALTLIADKKGFFREYGLDPQITYNLAGRQNMDALLAKGVELANTVEVNLAYQALAYNTDLVVLSSIVKANDYGIVVHPKSHIDSLEALRGKTLAFAPGTGAEAFVFAMMSRHGLDTTTVHLRRIPPTGLIDAIGSAAGVDAIASWEPTVSRTLSRLHSNGPVLTDQGGWYYGMMTATVRKSWAEANPLSVIAVQRSLKRAAEFVRDSTDSAKDILAAVTELPRTTIDSIWRKFDIGVSVDADSARTLTTRVAEQIVTKINPKYRDHRFEPVLRGYFEFMDRQGKP